METTLSQSQKKYQAIFENASVGIIVIDKHKKIVLVNDFLYRLFKYNSKEEIINQDFNILISKRYYDDNVRKLLQEAFERGADKEIQVGTEIYGVRKDGAEIPVEVSLTSYKEGGEKFYLAFLIDITLRMEIRSTLREQRADLQRINKDMERLNADLEMMVEARTSKLRETMEELELSRNELTEALNKEKELGNMKNSFVSLASHEFKTPLSTILSSASLLSKYTTTEDQSKRDRHIQRIQSAVTNMNNILNEFLSLRRLEHGKMSANIASWNIPDIVKIQAQEMTGILKQGQKIVRTHRGDSHYEIDESLFKNVIINLLSNAIKFSGKNSTIYIDTQIENRIFTFQIKDEGVGIPPSDMKYIGQLFFRAGNATNINGTGLGLHIVAQYIEIMNGVMDIQSEPNKGTTITITFRNGEDFIYRGQ